MGKICIVLLTFILSSLITKIEAQTYSLFHENMEEVIMTINIKDKKEITLKAKEQELNFPLVALAGDSIYAINKKDSCVLIKFLYDDAMLELYTDTAFTSVDKVRQFVVNQSNLHTQMAFYLIKGVTLSQIKTFPGEEQMINKDKETIAKIEQEYGDLLLSRGLDINNPILSLMDMNKDDKEKARSFLITTMIKFNMKKQALTYLLGYKPKKETR